MSDTPESDKGRRREPAALLKEAVPGPARPAPKRREADRAEDTEKPRLVVLLPNAGRPLFPGAMAPFSISDKAAVRAAVEEHDAVLGVVQTVDPAGEEVTGIDELYPVGVTARIVKSLEDDDDDEEAAEGPGILIRGLTDRRGDGEEGPLGLILKGRHRFRLKRIVSTEPYLLAEVTYPPEKLDTEDDATRALALTLTGELKRLVKKSPVFAKDVNILTPPVPVEDAGRLADMAAVLTSAKRERMQEILAAFNVRHRLSRAILLVKEELRLVGLQRRINRGIEEKVSRQQHDFFLREQLKAIKKELGLESDPKTLEINRFLERVEGLTLSEEAAKVVHEEIEKLRLIEPNSPEFNVSRTYLDWLTALPWGIEDREGLDLKKARRILDEDHHGLNDIKERIVEYLAVHKLKGGSLRGSILCLVGPPGVGKTSMGRSIARTLGRKFFRFSLGGMRDEAEIKGHRRTYVGAMPGKIIQALKRVGSANPVIMLDEIDKLASSYQGDPSSALLEVLDPEQNSQFLDHYLDVRFDLSDVFFIATANVVDTVPRALLDRMEVIRLSGYIEQEKMIIARKFLLPKQLAEHGIGRKELTITTSGLRAIARGWAREAGVRKLEQQLARVCRKVATRVATEGDDFSPVRITGVEDLKPLLGEPRFREEALSRKSRAGIAVGLAWTRMGGATLEVEAVAIPGKKSGLKQTGQLGSVMVESTNIAYSYVSSRVRDFHIDPAFFDQHLIHLHVPAGATPKDGPSAGITMGCAILSLALNQPLRRHVAMTGELTLTGRVLSVGGIREKVIAARRQRIREVILPAGNERDLKELPDHLKQGLAFHLVDHFDQVVGHVLPRRKG
jgi:ATP-dependent Lon protease